MEALVAPREDKTKDLILTGRRLNEIQMLRWEDGDQSVTEKKPPRLKDRRPNCAAVEDLVSVLTVLPRKDDSSSVIVGKISGTHLTDIRKP